jgi:hypothetical protein
MGPRGTTGMGTWWTRIWTRRTGIWTERTGMGTWGTRRTGMVTFPSEVTVPVVSAPTL